MTRVLCLADTHIGKTLYQRDRLDEQAATLSEIAHIASTSGASLIIHSGDIMDSASPSPEALAVVLRWFAELRERDLPLILILGNHDGWGYWRAHADAYRAAFGIHVVSEPCRLAVAGVDVACMPWLFPFRLGSVITDEYQGPQEYASATAWVLRTLLAEPADILATHMRFGGARLGQVERPIPERYIVPPRILDGLPFRHLVAGDVHLRQTIGDRGGYIGSPTPLDFGESGNPTSCTLIDTETGTQTEKPLRSPRRLIRLDMSLIEAIDTDPDALVAPDDADRIFAHIHIQTNGYGARVADYVHEKFPWALKVTVERVEGYGLGDSVPAKQTRSCVGSKAPRARGTMTSRPPEAVPMA